MTFKQFLVNYLSPWYLALRLFWLCDASLGFFFTTGILVGQGWSQRSALFVGYAVAAVFLWIALRPWKVGASYRDIECNVDELNRKFRSGERSWHAPSTFVWLTAKAIASSAGT